MKIKLLESKKSLNKSKGITAIEIVFGATVILAVSATFYLIGNYVLQKNKDNNEVKYLTKTLNDIDTMTMVANSYEGLTKDKLSLIQNGTSSYFGIDNITSQLQTFSIHYKNIPSSSCITIAENIVKLNNTSVLVNGLNIPINNNENKILLTCSVTELNKISITRKRDMVTASQSLTVGPPIPTQKPSIIAPPIVSPISSSPIINTSQRRQISVSIPVPYDNTEPDPITTPIPSSLPVQNSTNTTISCNNTRIFHSNTQCWVENLVPNNQGNACIWVKNNGKNGSWSNNTCSLL